MVSEGSEPLLCNASWRQSEDLGASWGEVRAQSLLPVTPPRVVVRFVHGNVGKVECETGNNELNGLWIGLGILGYRGQGGRGSIVVWSTVEEGGSGRD